MTSDQAENSAGRQGVDRRRATCSGALCCCPNGRYYESGGWLEATSAGLLYHLRDRCFVQQDCSGGECSPRHKQWTCFLVVSEGMILCLALGELIVNTQALSKHKISEPWLVVGRMKKWLLLKIIFLGAFVGGLFHSSYFQVGVLRS